MRIIPSSAGSEGMSSRWISTSASGPGGPPISRFTWAWTAFTIELLPAPREPHSRALLAGKPLGEAPRVVEQGLLLAVDAHQQVELDPVDLGHGFQAVAGGVPDIGFGRRDVGAGGGGRGEPVERFGDA